MKRLMIAVTLLMLLTASAALAQTVPSVEVFSPGLKRVSEMLAQGAPVRMSAGLGVTDMYYARDLSVLEAMLEGMTLHYDAEGTASQGADSIRIERGGETLLSMAHWRGEDGAALAIGDAAYALAVTDEAAQQAALIDFIDGTAILERAPLEDVAAWIESLAVGDELIGGFAVAQAFTLERTMSDDGTRLTKINITGSVARDGETPWAIEGFMRQPAGRAPKDTMELTFTQDEKNFLELTYSCLRESEVTRKDKKGQMNVDTYIKLAGKLGGYNISSRLNVYLRNAWTADGENLSERVTVSFNLTHTDKTPIRAKQNLNNVEGKLRFVFNLTTQESGNEVIALTEEITATAELDGNMFLDVEVDAEAEVGGDALELAATDAADATQAEIDAAVERAMLELTRGLYRQLDEDTKEKITKGL